MPSFSESVFINCPFTSNFKPLFDAMVFTTIGCGFTPRCTKEINDVDDIRITKIMTLIRECKYGIHDVSLSNGRLNMPLELGLFMGCKEYGGRSQAGKRCIVFEEKDYKSKAYLSDLGGQDMMAHNKKPNTIIKKVREWLAPKAVDPNKIPHSPFFIQNYTDFQNFLPGYCAAKHWDIDEISFNEYVLSVSNWLLTNPIQTP
ncbi:hypothetical protein [Dyadobacter sp. CY323]|uniref:hypothetical protein n=1 Tax=Dyadobacter sp. CY323 TaxID=2907302 RepID=UPI001F3D20E1|nr:hypothetical protein [Dyadobacter sp. CY323]MCE6992925.1 hypothetical protein [Dyadobacter sp. CY323]